MTHLDELLAILTSAKIDFVIVGGVAATLHGSAYITQDLDICYSRTAENLNQLVNALAPIHPRLRGAPAGLPFLWDVGTLRNGMNFTLTTDLGDIDLLGEISGIGDYLKVASKAMAFQVGLSQYKVLSLDGLIAAKKTAGRPKDQLILPELEALREAAGKDEDVKS